MGHVDAFDRRRLRQQLGGVRAQRLRGRPVEVSLATGFVEEGIEDARMSFYSAIFDRI